MELIVAPAVKRGDRVAIVAPASPVSADLLEAGIVVLKSWLVYLTCTIFAAFFLCLNVNIVSNFQFINQGLWHQFRKISFSSHLSCSG